MALIHLKRTIEFATPGTRLSIRYEQLVIERPDLPTASVPIEELGVVVLDEARCTLTQSVLSKLAESSVCVVVCGRRHLPTGLLQPISSHSLQVHVQRSQLDVSLPQRKRLWQSIVQAKIRAQGNVLKVFSGDDSGLHMIADRVLSGDSTNREAHAAQRYWRRLFGESFRRDRDVDGVNALLNYGYAIVRAAIARTIVATGMLPSIGLFHHNRSNAFCLADDLLEPFRPFVDARVKEITKLNPLPLNSYSLEDRDTREQLLSLLAEYVLIGGDRTPLGLAVAVSTSSLRKSFESSDNQLLLPTFDVALEIQTQTPIRVGRKGVKETRERESHL